MTIILSDELCKVEVSNDTEYKKWMIKNEPQWNEDYIPIPKFHLQTTTRQFGNGVGRVMSTAFAMECAAEDTGYLKLLLNKLYTNRKPQYDIFVPTGYYMVMSVEDFKVVLRRQNACLQSVNAIAVKGISDSTMWEHIKINGDKTSLGYFLKEVEGLEAIEQTNKTEKEGKWFFICKKEVHRKIKNLIDSTLPLIFQEQISSVNKLENN
eukprot:13106189-Ditylum_brightwellii.AAC.1